jgi:outer membrane cobalamin receptor
MNLRVPVRVSGNFVGVAAACLVVFSFLAIPSPASAFPDSCSLTGVVQDPSSHPVAGARVSARSDAGVARSARTSTRGAFVFDDIPCGPYDVIVTMDGFRADAIRIAAQSGSPTTVSVTLRLSAVAESLVVSASYVEMPLSEVPSGTTAISRHDIEARQFVTVADALRLAPGATMASAGGLGSTTSLFSRGGESDFTLVLVDGVKVNSVGGGFDFAHLTTGSVSSVEVVRGPQSAVFGADAIGGVVHVRTAIGGPITGSATIEAGGYGTTHVAAGTTGSVGTFRWGAHVEQLTSDGWTTEAPNSGLVVSNDDYTNRSVALSGEWRPSTRTTFRADTRVGTNERGYPGPFGSNPAGSYAGIDTVSRGTNDLGLGSLSFVHEFNPGTAVRVLGSWMEMESDYESPYGHSMSRSRRWTGHAQVDRAVNRTIALSAGVDASFETADNTYITGSTAELIPVERRVEGYFGEARFRAASRLFVTAGLRLEHIVRAELDADAYGSRPIQAEEGILSLNPRVAASYYLRTSAESGGNWSRVHASAGTGIRAPDALEIAYTDNAELKPERSRSLDAGVEQSVFGGRVVMDTTAFWNTYDDLIVAVGTALSGASRFQTDNIANARTRGAEVSAALRLLSGFEARLAYTFLDSEILAVDKLAGVAQAPFSVGTALLRRPRHQGSVDLLLERKRWSTYVRAAGRGAALDVEPNYGTYGGLFDAPGYVVLDAGASVRLAGLAVLTARVDNLLDKLYEPVLGYPAQGRTFTVGIRLAARR